VQLSRIRVASQGPVAVLTLPGGPLDARTIVELDEVVAGLDEGAETRVVVLEAEGPDFCSGTEAGSDPGSSGVDPPRRLATARMPIVAAVRGACRSAGLELILGADMVVAEEGSVFGLSELAEGRLTRWGGIQRLVRALGAPTATAMVLLGQEISAGDAHRLGLVHEVAPPSRARAIAEELARRGPLALEYAKEAVRRGAELPLAHALRLEADFNHLLATSEDRAEGLDAFFAKRPPRFRGR